MMGKARELAERIQKKIWWSAAINRWRDQTGTCHAVHGGGALCGAKPYDMGGSEATPEATGAQACKRCQKIIDRAGSARL